ncbi:hypothetical protein ONE63_003600 [Megalurothrips usitatus]|uniref:Cytochrome P450 n=1 Tax=Megalurothrips usitatus TaxID=439358 RepID=A0AAV7X6Y1_9NEOP|nr:hypothetical protein ONE63_003600 [Megalurothrips usitatus]
MLAALGLSIAETLVGLVAVLAVVSYLRLSNYWTRKGIPCVKGLPLIGSAPSFVMQSQYRGAIMQRFYEDARAKGQPCVGLFLTTRPTLLVVDLDLARTILIKDFSHFTDRGVPSDRVNEPLTANLFTLEGQEWRTLRHKLTPTFTAARMRAMFPLVLACAEELVAVLRSEAVRAEPVEMFELLARFTTDVIGSCAFGIQTNTLKDPDAEFRTMGRNAFSLSPVQGLFRFVAPQVLPYLRRVLPIRLVPQDIHDFFTKMFQNTVAYRQKNHVVRHDFVDLLLQLKTKGKLNDQPDDEHQSVPDSGIDEDILPAQAFVFFLAGFETSSSTLANCLTELSQHPEVQERLREEVDRVLAAHDGKLSYDVMHEMTYMEQVLQETMRMYPAASNIPRVVTEAYTLPFSGPDGKPAVLEKGTPVLVPNYAIHHDPEYYPDPYRFDPERFTEEAKQSRPHYSYMPFGEGPRICIGMRFAMMQMKAGLTAILRTYRVSPCEDSDKYYPPRFVARSVVTKVEGGNKVRLQLRA